MQYTHVLFDLDGTLSDSAPGITRSVAYALEAFGIRTQNCEQTLLHFIGPPLDDSFMEFCGFPLEQAKQATEKYRERYNVIGLYENTVYPGIPQLLDHLLCQGRTLLVATSKPTPTTIKILDHFGLTDRFRFIAGSEFDGTRGTKAQVIEYALEQAGLTDLSQAVMIGDRRHDVAGAKAAGIDCIGVLYGFGSRGELEAAGADWICPTVNDLQDWFDKDR